MSSQPKWAFKVLVATPTGHIETFQHHEYAEKLALATGGRLHPIEDVADYGPRFIKLKPAAQEQFDLSQMAAACAAAHRTTEESANGV